MRRYLLIILFGLTLVLPFVVRAFVGGGPVQVQSTDGPELVIVTPHNQDIRRTFERAFADWHRQRFGTAVRITYLTPGGTNDIVRLLADTYGVQRDPVTNQLPPEDQIRISIDMAWGGGDTTFERELKPMLKPVSLDPAILKAAFPTPDLNGVPLYERTQGGAPPKWVGTVLSTFGIIYNPALYEALKLPAPATWSDLARPELAGYVAMTDPTRSGSAAMTYMMAIQRGMADAEEAFFESHPELRGRPVGEVTSNAEYQAALGVGWKKGMGTLLLMAANARYFAEGAAQPCHDVGSAEAAAGVAIDFYARVYQEEIGAERIRYVAPAGATAITPDPIGILYGVRGEREILANRFIEFLLSPEGQRLWNLKGGASPYTPRSLRRSPIRRDVYSDRSDWADDVNPFEQAGGFNVRQDWMRLFSDTRMLWAAAWIDSRGVLKDSYEAILRVSDPARRDALVAALADLPIEMTDVALLQANRQKIAADASQDARLWLTRQRIDWANRFRAHYEVVAAKARDAR